MQYTFQIRRSSWPLRAALWLVAIVLVAPSLAQAVPTVNVGQISLLANRPGQVIPIRVTGGDQVQGVDLKVQVGSGFGSPGVVGDNGPNITAVDLLGGTIFASNNEGGQQSFRADPQYWFQGVITQSLAGVSASGLLARVTLDTTGFTSGSFDLLLTGTLDGDTDFSELPADIAANLTSGTIHIYAMGDMNGDGAVNNLDVSPFSLALTDPGGYQGMFPLVDANVIGDINLDGALNNLDISPFAALLTGGAAGASSAVPEPTSGVLLLAAAASLGLIKLVRARRR